MSYNTYYAINGRHLLCLYHSLFLLPVDCCDAYVPERRVILLPRVSDRAAAERWKRMKVRVGEGWVHEKTYVRGLKR